MYHYTRVCEQDSLTTGDAIFINGFHIPVHPLTKCITFQFRDLILLVLTKNIST